jgi:hypothetical protein
MTTVCVGRHQLSWILFAYFTDKALVIIKNHRTEMSCSKGIDINSTASMLRLISLLHKPIS